MSDPYAKRRAFERLYASLPTIECKKLCSQSCGPILMSAFELKRIERASKKSFDALAILDSDDRSCPALTPKQTCSAYDARPLICRLFGVAFGLECPHGCKPSRVMPRSEAQALIAEADRLSEG